MIDELDPDELEPGDVPAAEDHVHGWTPRRVAVLTVAALRYVIPIAAIPLVPVWLDDRLPLLLLLRPGKELLLVGGFQARNGDVSVLVLLAAYTPLMILAVWNFFALGRIEGAHLLAERPGWFQRIAPRETVAAAQRVLIRHGLPLAVIGRTLGLPPTILAAAAGTTRLRATLYLAADLVGALLAFGVTVALGWALGSAYEQAGPWLTGVAIVGLLAIYAQVNRWIQAEMAREEA